MAQGRARTLRRLPEGARGLPPRRADGPDEARGPCGVAGFGLPRCLRRRLHPALRPGGGPALLVRRRTGGAAGCAVAARRAAAASPVAPAYAGVAAIRRRLARRLARPRDDRRDPGRARRDPGLRRTEPGFRPGPDGGVSRTGLRRDAGGLPQHGRTAGVPGPGARPDAGPRVRPRPAGGSSDPGLADAVLLDDGGAFRPRSLLPGGVGRAGGRRLDRLGGRHRPVRSRMRGGASPPGGA